MSKLTPIDLECNMGEDVNGVEHREPWKAYDIDEVDALLAEKDEEIRRLRRALWLARAERYKMREFIAREEGNLSSQMSWSRFLRERTYNQWVGQLLKIANLANKLQNKCRAKADEYT